MCNARRSARAQTAHSTQPHAASRGTSHSYYKLRCSASGAASSRGAWAMFEGASAGPVRFESRHAVSLGSVTQPQPQGKAQAPTTRFKAVRQSPVVGRGLLNLGGCTHSGFGFRGDFMIDTSQCPAGAITRMHSPLTGAAANTSRPDQAVVGVLTDELARRCKQLTWGVDVNRRATTLSIHTRGRVACLPTAAGGARQSLRQGQRSSPRCPVSDQVCIAARTVGRRPRRGSTRDLRRERAREIGAATCPATAVRLAYQWWQRRGAWMFRTPKTFSFFQKK